MYKVKKRDGQVTEFEIQKIASAIKKAFEACDKPYNDSVIDMISLRVTSDFAPKVVDDLVDVEVIQDSAERVLSEAGYADVAKAYILYRKTRENVRNIENTTLDYKNIVDGYLNALDWNAKDGTSQTYSVGGLILSNSGAITANYWLNEAYDEEIASAHRSGDIHIHDLDMLTGYCAGWSLKQLIKEGLGGIPGQISSSPAKHLSTICSQMVNFIGIMQNEWAGAQSFSSVDTYLAPFVKVDGLSYKDVKQELQTFVYGVNTPSRWGTQPPFTTITMDWNVPEDMKELPALVSGKEMDFQYKDCQEEMNMINRAFLEVMMEGDSNHTPFRYPIPTYSLTPAFDWNEKENNQLLFKSAEKYGIPYFANYISTDHTSDEVRTMIRMKKSNYSSLYQKGGGFFGSGENTGSIGTVTINLARIGYLSKSKDDFIKKLDRVMDVSARCLKTKRTVLNQLMESGLFPYTKRYLGSFSHHFSTIGVVGMNEACLNAKWLKKNIADEESQAFTKEMLEHMKKRLLQYQKDYKDFYNLEATPAEKTAHRLAKLDMEEYPGIVHAGTEEIPYYTNSTNLPVDYTDDLFTALDIQNEIQSAYTSGTAFQVFLAKKLASWQACKTLVEKIASNYHIPYFAITPTYSFCLKHGYFCGEHEVCPKCGNPIDVYSRISGYYRPIALWNDGKKQEFEDRKEYIVE